MKHLFAASLLGLSAMLLSPYAALASSGTADGRYFMASTHSFWENLLGIRHTFDEGFTADLGDIQLRIAKLAGLKPIAVEKFTILAQGAPEESVSPTPAMVPSQPVSWGVRAMLGNDTLTKTNGGAGITIAILDTGIDSTHPDLSDRIAGCFDLTDSAQGLVEGSCDDRNGHGTHMAGIIAADGGPQGAGLFGFAPQATLSVYRVCNSTGTCMADDVAVAIRNAADAGSNIVVLGMGADASSSLVGSAISYASEHGVMVIAAAGNGGPYPDSLNWPARDPAVVSVGALDNLLQPADFSSHGAVEFTAPGVNVESTYRDNGYAILSGTSMAAPHIAGLAALLWQSDAEHPAAATRLLLDQMARDIPPVGPDDTSGRGFPVMAKQ